MIRSPSASRPVRPASPGRGLAVGLVVGVAIGLGCGFWLGREEYTNTETTVDQPEDTVTTASPDLLLPKAVGPSSTSGQLLPQSAQALRPPPLLPGVNGVADINAFLRSSDFDAIDIKAAAAHIAALPGGLQYLVSAQLKPADGQTELRTARLLAELKTPDIASIAADFMLDESSKVRRRAYALLSNEAVKGSDEASALLLDASYSEIDPLSLAALVFGLAADSSRRLEQGRSLDQAALARLDDLAGEGNRGVAASALLALARLRPDERTMQLISESLASQSTTLRESAVDALANFEQIDGPTIATLNALANDQSVPLFIRRKATTALSQLGQTRP